MRDRETTGMSKTAELERQLQEAREKALYYQWLAVRSGLRSVREIDQLSHAYDQLKKTEDILTYRIALDALITAISTRFISMQPADIDSDTLWALRQLGEFYGVERSYILIFSEDYKTASISHMWCVEEKGPQLYKQECIQTDKLSWLVDRYMKGEPFCLDDIDDLPDEKLRIYFKSYKVKSLVAVPMFYEDGLIGIMGLGAIRRKRKWNNDDVRMITTISGIIANATERHRIEHEHRQLEAQLQVRQRIDSLGVLVSGIAHDINNLLLSIMGNIDLFRMKSAEIPHKLQVHLDRSFTSCQRAANLMKEIQAFSKETATEKKNVDIFSVAEEMFEMLERTTHGQIEKRNEIEPGRYNVWANADLLHQVLFNLATNAVQAIEERGVKHGDYIRISAERSRAVIDDKVQKCRDNNIHIMFEDNGIGMTEEVRTRAFDPLFSTKRDMNKGQGLGLAMVYNIVTKNHNGIIEIESAEGKGTTYHIYLPEAPGLSEKTEAGEHPIAGGDETILVVEDDFFVVKFLEDTLGMFGYRMLSASDWETCMEILSAPDLNVDLVLLDITMPSLPGETILDSILSLHPDVKVIVTTGHGEEARERYSHVAEAIIKPFTVNKLARAVRTALET